MLPLQLTYLPARFPILPWALRYPTTELKHLLEGRKQLQVGRPVCLTTVLGTAGMAGKPTLVIYTGTILQFLPGRLGAKLGTEFRLLTVAVLPLRWLTTEAKLHLTANLFPLVNVDPP